MDKLSVAVDHYVQQLEAAIAPGLSFQQFVSVEQSIEESLLLELGDSALDHFMKCRQQLTEHRVRLQRECEKRYHARCREAYKQLFEGDTDLRQEVFSHFSEYVKDPSCVERDWDQWSTRFLSLCGLGEDVDCESAEESSLGRGQVQLQVLGEESRLLLGVLKRSAVQMVANVTSEAAQQVTSYKQALLRLQEQLDQSSLDIIRLQGEKENSLAICRSLESRVFDLQQQQNEHSEVVRALHNQLSLSELEVKKRQQENETAWIKCEKLVVRLVAKTKEASVLTGEKALLLSENEILKRQQRHQSGKGKKSGGGVDGGGGADAKEALQLLNVAYSKQVLEVQAQLDAVLQQLEEARDSEECMAKKRQMDQERLQHLQDKLDITSSQLNESAVKCSQLEGKLDACEEECKSREKQHHTAQESHRIALSSLHAEHTALTQEQTSRISLLLSQAEAAKREVEACVARVEVAEEAVQRTEARSVALAHELTQAQTRQQKQANVDTGSQSALKDELLVVQQELESVRATLLSEQQAHQKKELSTRQAAQHRVQELDLAYFRVEAELRMKTAEAKKYFSAVKQLEEETSALDRLRRKAELQLEQETQRRLVAEKAGEALSRDLEERREELLQSRAELDSLQREHAIMVITQEAAVDDMAVLLDKAAESKETIASLRTMASERNDLDYALSEMTKEKEQLVSQIAALEEEVASLSPLQGEVDRLGAELQQLQSEHERVAANTLAANEKELRYEKVLAQFEEVSQMNKLLVAESEELEGQLETLSVAFEQRGNLLGDLERRLDVSSSDAAYLRGENAAAREQIRELGEKVQTLMSNYNEASEQNEEKSFALLQLNGQQHELQSNLSQLAGELAELRDLPDQLTHLQAEHSRVSTQLTETLATLEELSLLSAGEMQSKDAALAELQQQVAQMAEENKELSQAHGDLVHAHSVLTEDREALFAAYSVLDSKLSNLEAEIME